MHNYGAQLDRLGRKSGYERVLSAVKHGLAEGHYEEGMLPSYRKLARELSVTKASVERAMAQLEREGLIRREIRRGALPRGRRHLAPPEKSHSLQSISILERWFAFIPSFVEADYLAGYTEALDYLPYPIRTRFIAGNELDSRNKKLFSPVLPIDAQGVVLINSTPPELMKWLQRQGVPFVVQYYTRYDVESLPPHFGIYVNKSGGASQAVNHLLELGHRSIGFMGPMEADIVQNPMAKKFQGTMFEKYHALAFEGSRPPVFEGYRAALICAGLDCMPNNIAHCTSKEGAESFAVAKEFLSRPQLPTAILAGSDGYALALLTTARELHIRVPEDLSIIGFNNEPGTDQSDPPLTTVSVPRRELAKCAVELLLEVSATPRVPPRTRILNTHLIIRETTAPPRVTHDKKSSDRNP